MNAGQLSGLSILVLEDDYYLADDARAAIEGAGGTVLGPCRDAADAAAMLEQGSADCALVDVNLGGGPSFAPAREFLAAGVRVLFITGYDETVVPADLAHLPRLEKPTDGDRIVAAIAKHCAP